MPDHRIELYRTQKWVRVYFGGRVIADSRRVVLLREEGLWPLYFFPQQDVRMELLERSDHRTIRKSVGEATYWSVCVDDRIASDAAWAYPNPNPTVADLKEMISFDWEPMDAWFEEDEELFSHARDPYHRVDAIPSSRHVKVVVGGMVIAETHRPVMVFETGVHPRYYIPKTDVRMDHLLPSETRTECPYKGVASYYSVEIGDRMEKDLVWYYPFPIPGVANIRNLVSFYQGRVDSLYDNGELVRKPKAA
jgi:uncharacterized protein (DUF427 family)